MRGQIKIHISLVWRCFRRYSARYPFSVPSTSFPLIRISLASAQFPVIIFVPDFCRVHILPAEGLIQAGAMGNGCPSPKFKMRLK